MNEDELNLVNPYEFTVDGEPDENFIPSGLPTLDLLLTNRVGCCFRKGTVVRLIGDSGSGKSMLGMHLLATVAKDKNCKDYAIHYFDREMGIVTLPVAQRFGKDVADKLNYWSVDDLPDTIEGMHQLIRETCLKQPSIIVIDSLDTLLAEKEKAFIEESEKLRKDNKTVGEASMCLSARASKLAWKSTNAVVAQTRSIVIMISQTIDSPSPYASAYTTSGGNANNFFATISLGLKIGAKLMKKDRFGNERQIGNKVTITPIKNRQTAIIKESVDCTLYYALGFCPQEDVFDMLNKRFEVLKSAGAYIKGAEFIMNTPDGTNHRRGDIMKTLVKEPGAYERALSRMKEEWIKSNEDFASIF